MTTTTRRPMTPAWDPWDPWRERVTRGIHTLTSIEVSVTEMCNMRCEHCAVGETLVHQEGVKLPLDLLMRRLDEVDNLQTLSITGGEPILNRRTVSEYIHPLLRYARERGVYTQLNSNLTLPLDRYVDWIDDLDVLHISYNYRDAEDFHRIAFHHAPGGGSKRGAERLWRRLWQNAQALSKAGVFVSAETLMSPFTAPHLPGMHRDVISMGCSRHEVHPLYPSDFAKHMDVLSLDELREAIDRLLEARDPNVWMLFGTLPFFPCSDKREDRELWLKLHEAPNVTVRQDPDGRNRLNINAFSGDVFVTDFAEVPALGNIYRDRLDDVFARWLGHPVAGRHHCFCPKARCAGPNVIVADTYYRDWDFTTRDAKVAVDAAASRHTTV